MNYLDSLGDGWTIYLWLVAGGMIIAACIYGIYWASHNQQFDEDIKYLVFSKTDKDKMTPEEYSKSRQVLSDQEESRKKSLQALAEKHKRVA